MLPQSASGQARVALELVATDSLQRATNGHRISQAATGQSDQFGRSEKLVEILGTMSRFWLKVEVMAKMMMRPFLTGSSPHRAGESNGLLLTTQSALHLLSFQVSAIRRRTTCASPCNGTRSSRTGARRTAGRRRYRHASLACGTTCHRRHVARPMR